MEDRGLRPHFPRLLARSFPFLSRSISAASLPCSFSPAQYNWSPTSCVPVPLLQCRNASSLLLPLPPAIPSPAMNSLLLPPNRPRPPRPRPTHTHFTPVLPSSLSFPPSARCAAGQTAGDGREELRKLSPGRYAKTTRPPTDRPTDNAAYRATLTGIRERAAAPSNGPARACKVTLVQEESP